MGILNVTPDSFYDGGQFEGVRRAGERAREMIAEGADIIDIGGESTGPGSLEVSLEEELRRVIPVVRGIRNRELGIGMSVDTYKAEVARQALEAGANMVNDVTAGRGDREMFRLIAEAGCVYVMMRSKDDSARTTKRNVQYEDVMRRFMSSSRSDWKKLSRQASRKSRSSWIPVWDILFPVIPNIPSKFSNAWKSCRILTVPY